MLLPLLAYVWLKHRGQAKQRSAAEMSTKLMNYFSEQMSDVIEHDKKLTHEKIAEQLEAKLEDGAYWLKFKPSDGVRLPCYAFM